MTSKITIEVDFSNGMPYFQIVNDSKSNDVRDKLISFFRQTLGHTSSWAKISFHCPETIDGKVHFRIDPIRPHELEGESKIMAEQAALNKDFVTGIQS